MDAVIEGLRIDTRHWIGGERIDSPGRFTDVSPIDERPIAELARGGAREVDLALASASRAFPGWARLGRAARAGFLHRIADGIETRIEPLARVETMDNGALLRSHLGGVMARAAHNFRFFADALLALVPEEFDVRGHRNQVSWEPSGVAAIITPWNAPLMLASWRLAPALAAGCTVVFKPPEWAPLTASLLAEITAEAGLPEGVFNLVQGLGEEAGAALVADSRVRRIGFTGSLATGRRIAAAAAPNLTPLSFELGGKSPLLVMADADLELAAAIAARQYDNAGQVCLAGTRILVERACAADFLDALTAKIATIRQGDPRAAETDLGPQVSRPHFARIDGFVARARAAGIAPTLGGCPNEELGGLYYRPTLYVEPPAGAEILREEIFGPVLTVQRFDGEEEAIALANDSDYGLAATLITGAPERARRLAGRLSAGLVWVNCFFVRDLRQPFGGNRLSGIGREGGRWSFDFYCDLKNSVFAPEGWSGHG